jgi:hypothetical protein
MLRPNKLLLGVPSAVPSSASITRYSERVAPPESCKSEVFLHHFLRRPMYSQARLSVVDLVSWEGAFSPLPALLGVSRPQPPDALLHRCRASAAPFGSLFDLPNWHSAVSTFLLKPAARQSHLEGRSKLNSLPWRQLAPGKTRVTKLRSARTQTGAPSFS